MGAFVRGARGGWAAVTALVCCVSLAGLVGCGGGSGSDEDQIATNPTAPVIQSFSISSSQIDEGGFVDVTATFSGGTGVVTPGGHSVLSGVPLRLEPVVTTNYVLTVTGSGGVVTRPFTVTVNANGDDPSLTVAPSVVTAGGEIRIEVKFTQGTATLEPGFGVVSSGDVKIYKTSLAEAGTVINFVIKNDHSSFVSTKIVSKPVSVVRSPRINHFVLE